MLIACDSDVDELMKASMKKKRKVLTFSSNTPYPLPASTSLYQVFVHNLPQGVTAEELARAFRNCGTVNKVEILDYSSPNEQKEKKVSKIRQTSSESKMWELFRGNHS